MNTIKTYQEREYPYNWPEDPVPLSGDLKLKINIEVQKGHSQKLYTKNLHKKSKQKGKNKD